MIDRAGITQFVADRAGGITRTGPFAGMTVLLAARAMADRSAAIG